MSKEKAQNAYENMANRKMNCAQTVFSSFGEESGLERKLALQIAQGFGGGMGHTGQTCGAVTGAYMALGLAQKISLDNPRGSLEKAYELISEFNRKFKTLHGSLNCTELAGFDLGAPEKLAEAREKGVFTTKCPVFVRDAVKIVEGLLK
jgi:C_GCAxxG_C_C family probable redox protein